ncbi:hypothetical protein AAZV13_17G087100 [Glycine max]|uniref:Hydroxyproline O-galactosyltransferase GALT6 isoform B n=1 Tax=Glycine soja TaxID=3848 RepID=A0A445G4G6_GLYSO|nr:hydroxyproline O-galactosyltransferase GALT6-like isoform X2 [Glycine soja]RZB56080.1 Hydroxyproline O-galactosyltransferase GALT6 isoform B [Glycine soja]
MKRGNNLVALSRQRSIQILIAIAFLYVLFFTLEIPLVFRIAQKQRPTHTRRQLVRRQNGVVSALILNDAAFDSELYQSSCRAGKAIWEELKLKSRSPRGLISKPENRSGPCPGSVSVSGPEFLGRGSLMMIPCGLTLGSHVTVVGKPSRVQRKTCQFVMELLGLKTVEGEEPPRVLHFNPRLKGDWSWKPVIELNTCYRMHWGTALRCDGWKSRAGEDTVDGLLKCEKWIRGDEDNRDAVETKAAWWLKRLIGRTKRGFTLEDATGLTLSGDIDVHSVFAASLPSVHPNVSSQQHLEFSTRWRAPNLPRYGVELFVGILSAGNHFAERMAVRKSWMQHSFIKSSKVVTRFFVALHPRKEINVELKKEAEYFGDIVIVPYIDNYDLVVLKTMAICEYGVHTVSAEYIMKGDDDTFVKIDAVMNQARNVPRSMSFYIGNINYRHKPLRWGKWAVTYKEWPEEEYPPYANGPGYILSSDIAHYIISEFEMHKLRLFKMEDVSMGMWVKQFNRSKPVNYLHSFKFCQYGCVEGYYTAHYQSPRQMICLWDKLQMKTTPECCNMR